MELVNLNTIKNKINEFPMNASIVNEYRHGKSFSLSLFTLNKGLRKLTIVDQGKMTITYKELLSNIRKTVPYTYKYKYPFRMTIEEYLKLANKEEYIGLGNESTKGVFGGAVDLIDDVLFKSEGQPSFDLNEDYLYIFIRITPLTDDDFVGLLMSMTVNEVYTIKEYSNNSQLISSLGFILKLNNRYKIKKLNFKLDYDNANYNPIIKYSIDKAYINKFIFGDSKYKYRINYHLLYITNDSLLKKYDLEIVKDI